jgi:Spy/CpxP family protein refolding chaperone
MKTMRFVLPLLFSSGIALAQPTQFTDAQRVKLRAAAVDALVEDVQLDPATAEKVQQVNDKYKKPIADLRRDDAQTLRDLRTLVGEKSTDGKKLKQLSERLTANRDKLTKLRGKRLDEMRKVTTPQQFARLLVSWRSVNRAVHREQRHLMKG